MSITLQDLLPLLSSTHPKHINELLKELNLSKAQRPLLEQSLEQLKGYHLAREAHPQEFLLQSASLKGTLWMNPRGFGFVSVENSDEGNVYVDRHDLGGALHRDRVLLSPYTGPDGRLRGRVERVLERGTRTFVGVFREGVSASLSQDTDRVAYIYPGCA